MTPDSSSCIDLIFSSIPDKHLVTSVVPITLSNHFLVYSVLSFKHFNKQSHQVKLRSYNNFNPTMFLNEIRNSTVLSSIFNEHEVEVGWKTFFDEFIQICDRHAPKREFRVKSRNKPWISKDIIKLMNQRDFLHKKAIKTKDKHIFYQYKNSRNDVTRYI